MKKKRLILAVMTAALFCIMAAVFLFPRGKRPFRDLDAADISHASVLLTPPDRVVEIQDLSKLAAYLKDVVIYKKDQSYTEYAGQGVTFTLTWKDGTQTEITAFNPFLILDGVGYRTKYEPCEALNRYANELQREEDAAWRQEIRYLGLQGGAEQKILGKRDFFEKKYLTSGGFSPIISGA